MYGLEVRDYLVYIFREIMNGNKDYREWKIEFVGLLV